MLSWKGSGELVVVVLEGIGKVLFDDGVQRFCAPCTLVVLPGIEYTLTNQCATPMRAVVVTGSGARVRWRTVR